MRTPLHILHLESGALDAHVIQSKLAEAMAVERTCVQTLGDFVEALERDGYDIMLADYASSPLDGISALMIAREKQPDIPFIFVSRSPGDEAAIESLRMGAADFVLKHRLERLPASVIDAVSKAEERRRKPIENRDGHVDKIESIDRLAAGLSHDLNNLLTAIIGRAQIAQEMLDPADPAFETIKEIEQTGRRAAELTRQLMIFNRRQVSQPASLNEELADFVQTLLRIVSDVAEVRLETPNLPHEEARQAPATLIAASGATETILVAEDDEALLKLAEHVLEGLGYRVLLARDGLEAVNLFAAHHNEIDLVTLDISMPKLGGLEAYRRIRKLETAVPVILMSGDIEQASGIEETDAGLLEKPYSVESLGREVRKALDQARARTRSAARK